MAENDAAKTFGRSIKLKRESYKFLNCTKGRKQSLSNSSTVRQKLHG